MPQTQTQVEDQLDAEVELILNDLLSPLPEPTRKKIAEAAPSQTPFEAMIRKICGF
jgi:hypothetical protein